MARTRYKPDPNGQHARLYHSILNCPAWLALSSSAIRLYVDMRLKLNSYNNGNIEAVYSELRHRGWKSKTTMHKALRELETLGFIEQTRQGGIASRSKVCSLYRFTDQDAIDSSKLDIAGCKATHDYRQFTSIHEARAAMRESEAHRKSAKSTNLDKVKVQKLDVSSPESAPSGAAH